MINETIEKLCVDVTGVEFVDSNNHSFVPTIDMNTKGKYYACNHGCIAFTTENGKYYVSPFISELIPLLEQDGFVEGPVIVPFSNNAKPLNPDVVMRWYTLTSTKENIMSEMARQYEAEQIAENARTR